MNAPSDELHPPLDEAAESTLQLTPEARAAAQAAQARAPTSEPPRAGYGSAPRPIPTHGGSGPKAMPTRPPLPALKAGEGLCGGRYTVVEVRARARFGAHYFVQDTQRGLELSAWVCRADEALAAEVLAHASVFVGIAHANIARTLEIVRDGARLVALTERALGDTLAEHLARGGEGGIPVRNAVISVLPLAGAVAVAHEQAAHGMLDVGSVWIQPNGRLKIAGFGPAFAQAMMSAADARADDVRGLCRILYALLTGSPYAADSPPLLRVRPEIGSLLDAVLQRGLHGPAWSAEELGRALSEALNATNIPGEAAVPAPLAAPSEYVERWMIVKGHLDYGPFSLSQLRKEALEGRLDPQSVVKNVASGARGPVRDFAGLAEVARAHDERQKQLAAKAVEAKERAAHRGKRVRRGFVIAAVLGVVAAGAGYVVLQLLEPPEAVGFIAAASESSDGAPQRDDARVSVPTTRVGRDKGEPAGAGRRARSRKRAAAGNGTGFVPMGGAAASGAALPAPFGATPSPPEEAPPDAEVDFSDFRDPSVAAAREAAKDAIKGTTSRLRPCFDREARSPGFKGRFSVSFNVASTGKAYRVRVGGDIHAPRLDACIKSTLVAITYPKFSGLPLVYSNSFSIDR